MPNLKGKKSVYTDKISMSGRSALMQPWGSLLMVDSACKNNKETPPPPPQKKKKKKKKNERKYTNDKSDAYDKTDTPRQDR